MLPEQLELCQKDHLADSTGLVWPSNDHLKGLGSSTTKKDTSSERVPDKKATLEQETTENCLLWKVRESIRSLCSSESSQETSINFLSLQQEVQLICPAFNPPEKPGR